MRLKAFIHKAPVILSAVFIGIFMGTHTLAGMAPPTGVKVVTPSDEIPPSYFGMHIISTRHWPSVSVGALGKGTLVSWIYIETSRGTYDWQNLDRWVELAQSRGVTMFWSNCRRARLGSSRSQHMWSVLSLVPGPEMYVYDYRHQ